MLWQYWTWMRHNMEHALGMCVTQICQLAHNCCQGTAMQVSPVPLKAKLPHFISKKGHLFMTHCSNGDKIKCASVMSM